MSEFEMIAIATEIAVAGHETTANGVAKSILGLMDQHDRWDDLRVASEQELDVAVEELLRWTTPVAKQRWRWSTVDTEISGRPITRGDSVVSILAAANRDPEQFPDPDRIDFGRPAVRHLTFGFGSHFCLGAALARLEMKTSLRTLAEALPDMELVDPDHVSWKRNHILPGPASVWVTTPA
jgi:cytochrome P450